MQKKICDSTLEFLLNSLKCCVILFALLTANSFQNIAIGQVSTLTCNTAERMNTSALHPSLSVNSSGGSAFTYATVGGVLDEGNAISSSTTDYARIGQVLLSLGPKYISVQDAAGTYPAGTFAGFEISNTSLVGISLLTDISVSTYLSGSFQESVSGAGLGISIELLSTGSRGTVGFITTMDFDEVRFTSSGLSLLASETRVYNAVFEKLCTGPTLACNTTTLLTKPNYPLSINASNTGISGVICGLCGISNTDNLIDTNILNFASINLSASIGTSGSISVKDNDTSYAAGTFAGYDIETASLLSIGVLSSFSIATFKDGVATGDVATGASLISTNSTILSGSGRTTIGLMTTQDFDEVKITATNLIGLPLGTISLYGLVLKQFCSAPLPACNTLTSIINPEYPVYVDGQNSGVDGIACLLCSLENSERTVDNDLSNFASITLPAGVATSADFAVANALDSYPVNSFAGFDIETNTMLLASVISSATIRLYNNGMLVQTSSGNALIVGATSSLLGSTTRQIVGCIATVTFDEIKISFTQLIGADLGTIKIYSAVIEKTCAPNIFCNRSYYLNNPNFPAIINSQKTGLSGIATVLAAVRDPWNVVSFSTSDFARISNAATVAADASISVIDPLSTYPMGTFAGYVIQAPSVPPVLLDLFNAITISTYLDGTLQESHSGSTLINLTVLATLIGTPGGSSYNLGFVTTSTFDEIRISVSSLLAVGLLSDYVDVFGAFIDTRSTTSLAGLSCLKTFPDINATFLGMSIDGNVSTNDVIPSATSYGTPVAAVGNPAGTLPTMNPDGSYTFTPTLAGVYHFDVPVCLSGAVSPCPLEMLTITVLDNTIGSTNPPVVHTDIITTNYNNPVNIIALWNDAIGTPGTHLDTSSLSITDLNGASTGNSVNGGTAVANLMTGIVSYSPPLDFIGNDTIQYTLCDNQAIPQCATANIIVTVLAPGAGNTTSASDDYMQTNQGLSANSNVTINDFDSEGNSMSVSPQSTVVIGEYSFTLLADGSYTFTPDPSFVGPASIVYEVCDDAFTPSCAYATLYLLVAPSSFPLSIKLEKFEVHINNCTSIIDIITAAGTEKDSVMLQYSNNGIQWTTIELFSGKSEQTKFQYLHQPQSGKALYRLQIKSQSKVANYSSTKEITNDCSQKEIIVYPNPATHHLYIKLPDNGSENLFELSDAMGSIAIKGYLIQSIENKIELPNLASGIYTLKITGEKTVDLIKIFIKE
jgi:large repetitive protein